ncbi:zinc-binding dehydrogenase [Phormidium tenue FACHB-886]|nr:zinc-binding dehydrogenase [Phormidium tenue FACHB-886]
MQAMVITGHGGSEVFSLQDYPKPAVGDHDILIRVHATSINPVDCRVRRSSKVPRQFPLILGYDVSGTIAAIGKKVTGFEVGDEVYASPNVFRDGASAEYVAVDSRSASKKPRNLDYAAAATLPLVALTAWEALHSRAKIRPGATVLIHAGAGGVGHIAIQLAKLQGCRVITTAGREESIAFCQEKLKADEVINYRATDFSQNILEATNGKGCEFIFDTVGGEVFEKSMDCISINGQIVTIVPTHTATIAEKLFLKNVTLHYEFMGVPTAYNINPQIQGEILSALRNQVEAGLLFPHVMRQIDWLELPEGHQLQETGHVMGKIAVIVR